MREQPGVRERRLRQLLHDLERAIADAIDSPEILDRLRRIQAEGLQLRVSFDCKPQESEPSVATPAPPAAPAVSRKPTARVPSPVFRIHSEDLAFLRSIGIDPTRRRRTR